MKLEFDVVVLGGINTDYTIRAEKLPSAGQTVRGESFYTGPGGKGANQAVAAARLGARVAMIGRVGAEPRGRELIRHLRREKIDVRQVGLESREATGAAIIGVDAKGEKQIVAALGANLALKASHIRAAETLLRNTKVLLCNFETPVNCVLAAARVAARHGVKLVLDPAPPTVVPDALLKLVFALRPNSDEAEQMTGVRVSDRRSAKKAAEKLRMKGVRVVALEAGDEGNLVQSEEEEFFLPRIKVKARDATGAGDAFAAGFSVGVAQGLSLREAGMLANATAALSTTKVGAQEGLPSRKEVEALLRRSRR